MAKNKYQTSRKATLIGQNASTEVILADLSSHHAGVLSPMGAREGTELELVFEIPAKQEFRTLKVMATVIHRHNSSEGIYLKLEFINLDLEQYEFITDFLDYKQRLLDMNEHKQKM
ncbi:PilZ domain-containing protein [Thiomicrorhabdus sediminis]|uniref:PilZ domain-containing protein n=1 Tax=Thiomicrorhabdus sediminis TaxID=2580412 RepID=A0A4P9K3M4_9GAMM|nr:PilZ domain-containing protein [Thiomicrorhabdus sediminis]QCU89492.1 PilZ domain-containing protein [Thiomicrorhabdus sediminis]